MNTVSKVLVSIIGVLVIGFVGILLYIYWPAITGTVNGNKYYTAEEVQEAYDKGYNDGNTSEKELNEKLDYYKSLVDDYYTEVDTLNGEINVLNVDIANKQEQIERLETQKSELIAQVENLTQIKNNNETTISGLNTQIDTLQKQIADLSTSDDDKSKEIARLTEQVNNLQSLSNQLQKTNELNVETINSLNNQIKSLNTQISEMTYLMNNSSAIVSSLNAKIAELENSVAYYEQYIASLESGEQVVATFEFNGSVYNIQIVNKNDIVTVTAPTSTEYVIFNFWTVNGEQVDLSTFKITTNTKFVADVTLKFDAKFIVDNTEYDSQIVVENGYATLPANPVKEGYEFDGWIISGEKIVDVNSYKITQNTTFTAKFTQIHTVTYMYENDIIGTEQVRNGNSAEGIEVENTPYKEFNGWTFNDTLINISTYKITSSIVLKANIIYKYDVTFIVDDEEFETMTVAQNNYASISSTPTKRGYEFVGWSLNNADIVNVYSIKITSNTTFYAMFNRIYAFEAVEYKDLVQLTGQYVWNDGENVYYSYQDEQFVLDKETNTWSKKEWKGLESFAGSYIWTDGTNVYYSYNSNNYVLNKQTSVWTRKTWSGLTKINANYIWTDGTKIYHTEQGNHYILDVETSTWTRKNWSGVGDPYYAYDIWFAGNNVYCENILGDYYKFDKTNDKWVEITMVEPSSYFSLLDIWCDNENAYYKNYVFDVETNTWVNNGWTGLTSVDGDYMWLDENDNMYYSNDNTHYSFDKSSKTWSLINWKGISGFDTTYIWSTDANTYYSYGSLQYKLNKETLTWKKKNWNIESVSKSNIWSDGENFYLSSATQQYVLNAETDEWIEQVWNGLSDFSGSDIYIVNDDIYCLKNVINTQTFGYDLHPYKLDKNSKTWIEIDSNNILSFSLAEVFGGFWFWDDGNNLYVSSTEKQLVLNNETQTWETKTWNGLTDVVASQIWKFHDKIYYSNSYVLDKNSSTWIEINMSNISNFNVKNIWTDNEYTYYSSGYEQYRLNANTNIWEAMVWEGIDSFNGENVWTDGTNIYISDGVNQYKML